MINSTLATTATAMLLVVFTGACADTATAPDDIVAVDFEPDFAVLQGDGQAGEVAQQLPKPVIVRLTNPAGEPIAGMLVNFVVTTRTTNISAEAAGSVWNGTAFTNEDGIAWDWWTLGYYTREPQTLEVRYVNPRGVRRVGAVFTALPQASVPVDMVSSAADGSNTSYGRNLGSGLGATFEGGQPFALTTHPYTYLRLTDRYGNRVPDWPIALSVESGSAPDTIFSDSLGLAQPTGWVTGSTPDSVQFLIARAVGLEPHAPEQAYRDSVVFQTHMYDPTGLHLVFESIDEDTLKTVPDTLNVPSESGQLVYGPFLCMRLEDAAGNEVTGQRHAWYAARMTEVSGQTSRVEAGTFAYWGPQEGCVQTYAYPEKSGDAWQEISWDLRFFIPGIEGEVAMQLVAAP